MKVSEYRLGRAFTLRLEDGEGLPGVLEDFARENSIDRAVCFFLGGVKNGGKLVVGPETEEAMPPRPMEFDIDGTHESLGYGTIFPDADGRPSLHMHAVLGRGGEARAGCIRPGIDVWMVGEVVLLEIMDSSACRLEDSVTGFKLLEP